MIRKKLQLHFVKTKKAVLSGCSKNCLLDLLPALEHGLPVVR